MLNSLDQCTENVGLIQYHMHAVNNLAGLYRGSTVLNSLDQCTENVGLIQYHMHAVNNLAGLVGNIPVKKGTDYHWHV